MIKDSSIDTVRQAVSIAEVIGKHVTLKKVGAGLSGCCPFHNEKTPSFHVYEGTQTYKCFGCGAGGDVIKFVMEHERRTFIEAVELLASQYQIVLERDENFDETRYQQQQSDKDRLREVIEFSNNKYETLMRSLPHEADVKQYLYGRGYTDKRIAKWGLGYAPGDWRFLCQSIINMGRYNDAMDAGLVKTNEGKNYDAFFNKIIFPLHDCYGSLIGLSARLYTQADAEKYKGGKYKNPSNNLLYNKSRYWYGLWQAIPAIKQAEHAIIVEGYTDVHAMHDLGGKANTIAACGTAITPEQIKLLKRYTQHVVLCYDGDEAGEKAAMRNIDLFLEHQFKVSIIELPEGKDPDSYCREATPKKVLEIAGVA